MSSAEFPAAPARPLIHEARERVGDDELLGEADDAPVHPEEDVTAARGLEGVELGDELLDAQDRPGHHVRPEGREEQESPEREELFAALVEVEQVADALEGEERDPEREDQRREGELLLPRQGQVHELGDHARVA